MTPHLDKDELDRIIDDLKQYINDNCYPLEYCWPEDYEPKFKASLESLIATRQESIRREVVEEAIAEVAETADIEILHIQQTMSSDPKHPTKMMRKKAVDSIVNTLCQLQSDKEKA